MRTPSVLEEQAPPAAQKAAAEYMYAGYEIRVHFGGDNTLKQCIRNLADRIPADGFSPSSAGRE